MIDINLIRENPKLVKENIKKRFQKEKLKLVDEILNLDGKYRKSKLEGDKLRHQRNEISKEINQAKKKSDKKKANQLIKKAKKIPDKISKNEEKTKKLQKEINKLMNQIPNIIHESVPIGKSEKDNVEIARYGKPKKFNFKPKTHSELGKKLDMIDFSTSAKTSGKGFYYLKKDLALLNQALIRYAIEKMNSKGFDYIETPLMLRKKVMEKVADLFDMQNQIYKVQNEDLYLIGTAEHSLIGRFINQMIPEKELPIKNTSYSMCFRKEIGSHGIEEKGLYRTHQFNKIEMIILCKPEKSMDYFEGMKKINIEMFKELEIPVRVLEICSGDLGDLKHKQVDIEAYSPNLKDYYEIGSCSDLTDAQARKLGIRARKKTGEKFVPHTLNNTVIATSRVLIAIMENNQQKDGSIKIPKVLQKYMNKKKIIEADRKTKKSQKKKSNKKSEK